MNRHVALLAAVVLLVGSREAQAYRITVDGDKADWGSESTWEMALPTQDNIGYIARDALTRGQYVWKDTTGDHRTDFDSNGNTPSARADLTEFRVTGDSTNIYFLACFQSMDLSTGDGVVQLRVSIDRDPGEGNGNIELGDRTHLEDVETTIPDDAAWEYLVVTGFGSDGHAYVFDTSWNDVAMGGGTPVTQERIAAAENCLEVSVPWSIIGGSPTADENKKPIRFTVSTYLANGSDGAWDITNFSDALDVVSNYDDPGDTSNTWDGEIEADGELDYYFDVWFHLDPDVEPASPVLINEVYFNPDNANLEWIELRNETDAALSLAGYRIGDEETVDADEADEGMKVLPTEIGPLPAAAFDAQDNLTTEGVGIIARNATAFCQQFTCDATPPKPLAEYEPGANDDGEVPNCSDYDAWVTTTNQANELHLDDTTDEVLLLDPRATVLDVLIYDNANGAPSSMYGTSPVVADGLAANGSFERPPFKPDTNNGEGDFMEQGSPVPGVRGCEPCFDGNLYMIGDRKTGPSGGNKSADEYDVFIIGDDIKAAYASCPKRGDDLTDTPASNGVKVTFYQLTDGDITNANNIVVAGAPNDTICEATYQDIPRASIDGTGKFIAAEISYYSDNGSNTAKCNITEQGNHSVDNEVDITGVKWIIRSSRDNADTTQFPCSWDGCATGEGGEELYFVNVDSYMDVTLETPQADFTKVEIDTCSIDANCAAGNQSWQELAYDAVNGVYTLEDYGKQGDDGLQAKEIDDPALRFPIRITDHSGNVVEGYSYDSEGQQGPTAEGRVPVDLNPPPLAANQAELTVQLLPAGGGAAVTITSGNDVVNADRIFNIGSTVRVLYDASAYGDNDFTGHGNLNIHLNITDHSWGAADDIEMLDDGDGCDEVNGDNIYSACFDIEDSANAGVDAIDKSNLYISITIQDDGANYVDYSGSMDVFLDQDDGSHHVYSMDNIRPDVSGTGQLVFHDNSAIERTVRIGDVVKFVRGNLDVNEDDPDRENANITWTVALTDLDPDGSENDGVDLAAVDLNTDVTVDDGDLDHANHTFVVTATDDAGNTDTSSTDAISVDNDPPSVTDNASINIVTNHGVGGIVSVDDVVEMIAGTVQTADGDSWTVDLTTLTGNPGDDAVGPNTDKTVVAGILDDPNHTFPVTITDDAGNTTSSSTDPISVDNQPPNITTDATIQIVADVGTAGIVSVGDRVQLLAGHLSADDGDTWTVDFTTLTGDPGDAAVPAETPKDVVAGNIDDADHTFPVTVTDDAGNTDTSSTQAISVDNQPPNITSDATVQIVENMGVAGIVSVGDRVQLLVGEVSSADGDTWTVDFTTLTGDAGDAAVPAETPKDVVAGNIDDADHTFPVTVSDDAGNTDTSSTNAISVDNDPPDLDCGADITGNEGTAVSFAASIANADGDTVDWDWDDDDNFDAPNAGLTPDHTYGSDGPYTARCRATDDAGNVSEDTLSVTIANVAPNVTCDALGGPFDEGSEISGQVGHFSDPGEDDEGNHTASVAWGDGHTSNGTVDQAADQVTGTHTYGDDGDMTITLTVTDSDEGTGQCTQTITVRNVAPTLTMAQDSYIINEGDDISGSIATFTDPGSSDVHTATVDWGDGGGAENLAVDEDTGTLTGSNTYVQDGAFTITVGVQDDDGGSAEDTSSVTVNNVRPNIDTLTTNPANHTIDEGQSLSVLVSFSDPGVNDQHLADFTWGDGEVSNDVAANEQDGDSSGTVQDSHTYGNSGEFHGNVVVKDERASSNAFSFDVTVNNLPPVVTARADIALTEGSMLPNGLLANFLDHVADDGPYGATVDWGDGSPVEAVPDGSLTAPPGDDDDSANPGHVDISDGFNHRYEDQGTYTVTISVTDKDGDTGQDTFVVTVDNEAPVVTQADDQTVDEGSPLSMTISFTDSGWDDSPFTAHVTWGDGSEDDIPSDSITAAHDGVAGSFDIQHVYVNDGPYTVRVTVTDKDGATSASMEFHVTVDDVAPTVNPRQDPPQGTEGVEVKFQVATFDDPGVEDEHTAVIDWGDGNQSNGTITQSLDGNGNRLPQRKVTGAHTYVDDGTYTVTVTVTDDANQARGRGSFDITIVNSPPSATPANPQSGAEGTRLTNLVVATFGDLGVQDSHRATIDWGDGTPQQCAGPDGCGCTLAEPNDGVDGQVVCSHTYADDGEYTVTVTVYDDDDDSDTVTFPVIMTNATPDLTMKPSPDAIDEGECFTDITLAEFSDPGTGDTHGLDDGTAVDWGVGEGWVTQDVTVDEVGGSGTVSGSHCYCEDGNDQAYDTTVRVCDDDGACVTGDIALWVRNVAPTVDSVGVSAPGVQDAHHIQEGTTVTFDITASDPGCDDTNLDLHIDFGDATDDPGWITQPDHTYVHRYDDNCAAHVHQVSCTYNAAIRARDSDGEFGDETVPIVVDNVPPTIASTEVVSGNQEGQDITLRAVASDPSVRDMKEFKFCWDFDTQVNDDGQGGADDDCQMTTAGYEVAVGDSITSTVTWNYDDDADGRHGDGGPSYHVRVWVDDQDHGVDARVQVTPVANVPPVPEAGGYGIVQAWDPDDRVDPQDPSESDPQFRVIGQDGDQTIKEGYVSGDECRRSTVELLGAGWDIGRADQAAGFYYRWEFGDGTWSPDVADLPQEDVYCLVDGAWLRLGDDGGQCNGRDLYFHSQRQVTDGGGQDWVVKRAAHVYLDDIRADGDDIVRDHNGDPEYFGDNQVILHVVDKDGAEVTDTMSVTIVNVPPHPVPGINLVQGGLPIPLAGRMAIRNRPGDACNGGDDCIMTFTVEVRTDLEFTGERSCDPGFVDDAHLAFQWSFGDGWCDIPGNRALCRSESFARIFDGIGVMSGTLEVTDPSGAVTEVPFQVEVINSCDMAVQIRHSQDVSEGDPMSFTGEVLEPRPGESYTFVWTFGDGFQDSCSVTCGAGCDTDSPLGCTVEHTYEESGDYTVALTGRSDLGCTKSTSTTVTIDNEPPTITGITVVDPPEVHEGEPVHVTAEFTDPGRDSFTIEWNCDSDPDGTYESSGRIGTCLYDDDGTYSITVKVTDDDGGEATLTTDIWVHNVAPTPTVHLPVAVYEGVPADFEATAEDPGSGDDDQNIQFTWDMPDSQEGTGTGATVSFTFPDDGNYQGSVVATDDGGAGDSSDPLSFIVQVQNLPPRAIGCSTEPEFEAQLSQARYEEGVVPEHCGRNGASYSELEEIVFVAVATDPGQSDREGLRYVWRFGDGSVEPAPGEDPGEPGSHRVARHTYANQGLYTVDLTVIDPDGATATDSFAVNIGFKPPVCGWVQISDDPTEGEPTTVSVNACSAECTRPECCRPYGPGDEAPDGCGAVAEVCRPSQEMSYHYVWGEGMEVQDGPDASHVYSNDGAYGFAVTVVDPDGVHAPCPAEVMVFQDGSPALDGGMLHVANKPPTVQLAGPSEAVEGQPVRVAITSQQDARGDLEAGLIHTWLVYRAGEGAPIETQTDRDVPAKLLSFTKSFAEPGEYVVQIVVEDDHPMTPDQEIDPELPNVDEVTIQVGNLPPTVEEIPPAQGHEGEPITFVACATDPGGLDQGQRLRFRWEWGHRSVGSDEPAEDVIEGEVDEDACPEGFLGTISHVFPDNNGMGPYFVTVTALDPQTPDDGDGGWQTFSVQVDNVPPRIVDAEDPQPGDPMVDPFPRTVQPGQTFHYQFVAVDPGAWDTLRWELVQGPENMTIDRDTGLLTWDPSPEQTQEAGVRYLVHVKVVDKDGGEDEYRNTVVVEVVDTDHDGLPDVFEQRFSACLQVGRDDSGLDPDHDGLTNAQEYERDQTGDRSSPCEFNGPTTPIPMTPVDGATVTNDDRVLVAEKSTDPDERYVYVAGPPDLGLRYLFVVGVDLEDMDGPDATFLASNFPNFSDNPNVIRDLTPAGAMGIPAIEPRNDLVSWEFPADEFDLGEYENHLLQWRVRASDGYAFSPWSDLKTFFFNAIPEPPCAPVPVRPADGSENQGVRPVFEVQPSLCYPGDLEDPENGEVRYRFVIWDAQDSPLDPVLDSGPVAKGEGGTVTWQPPAALRLADDRWYCWQAFAMDDEDLTSEAVPEAGWCFLVNDPTGGGGTGACGDGDEPPGPPMLKSPRLPGELPEGPDRVPGENVPEITSSSVDLVFGQARDPDGNELQYVIKWVDQDDLFAMAPGFAQAQTEGPFTLALGEDGRVTLDQLQENHFYYWTVSAQEVNNPDCATVEPDVALFFVNAQEEPPDAPRPMEVNPPTVTPRLEAACALDPDFDRLTYECQVLLDGDEGSVVVEQDNIQGSSRGADCTITWDVPEGFLVNNQNYCFRCRACDHGVCTAEGEWGPWSSCQEFVPADNVCPNAPRELLAPGLRSHHPFDSWPMLEVANVEDPDANNPHTYTFEIYDTDDLEIAEPVFTATVEEGDGGSTSLDMSTQDVAAIQPRPGTSKTFYWRVEVSDPRAEPPGTCDTVSPLGAFVIDGAPLPPGAKDEGCCGHVASREPPRQRGFAFLVFAVLAALALVRRRG